jgi:hypothetical protein
MSQTSTLGLHFSQRQFTTQHDIPLGGKSTEACVQRLHRLVLVDYKAHRLHPKQLNFTICIMRIW